MTIICAYHQPGIGTWIGSDRLVTMDGYALAERPKWIVRAGWAVGVAGDKRTLNLLESQAETLLDEPPGAFTVASRIRDMLRADGYVPGDDPGPQDLGNQIIVAHHSLAWHVDSGFGVVEFPEAMLCAAGSGGPEARGAGHALGAPTVSGGVTDGRVLVESAIRAAIALDIHCGGEPWVHLLAEPAG